MTSRIPSAITLTVFIAMAPPIAAETDGLLHRGDERLFPIGCYELPASDANLEAMAGAGFNIVHCHSVEDLDRAAAAGLQGVVPLPLQNGATPAFRERVAALATHPALALWEGPDEVVWNFTAYSGLHRKLGIHKRPGAWWRQEPDAVAYAENKAAEIIPNMREAAALIRELDSARRPIWINEAQRSDVFYCRQYMDFVDITGCDVYPVSANDRNLPRVGAATERWKQIGRGKP
ncbi:MAG TPA: hypothetical protein ENN80_10850, partial [Candidatus Hydrogenedentes bacterium]|nr:hypothetical protein [Candidatus Hydrogenedentota bacterium]